MYSEKELGRRRKKASGFITEPLWLNSRTRLFYFRVEILPTSHDSALLYLGGAEFFGYQVHAVFQGSDQQAVCCPVVSQQLPARQIAMHVVDGDPAALRKLAVDLAYQQLNFAPQLFVIGNLLPA